MNEHVTFNGSPTADGYYTTLSPNEVTIDSSDEGSDGGSSGGDFSIAKITVINGFLTGNLGCIDQQDGVQLVVPYPPPEWEVSAVLYKGKCKATLYSVTEISGAIEAIGNGNYIITGDCTVISSSD